MEMSVQRTEKKPKERKRALHSQPGEPICAGVGDLARGMFHRIYVWAAVRSDLF